MSNSDLLNRCRVKYDEILCVDSNGAAMELDSLRITDLTFAVAQETGLDFYLLLEHIPADDLFTRETFLAKLSTLLDQ